MDADSSFDVSANEGSFARVSPFACKTCTYTSTKKYNLERHVRCQHVHPTPMTSTPIVKKYFCDQCSKSFTRKYGLKLHHSSKHLGVFKFICNICGQGFNQKPPYTAHRLNHVDIKDAACRTCRKKFVHQASARRHEKDCDAKKSKATHSCTLCDSAFTTKNGLSEHTRGMHGGRLYRCSACFKTFKW